MVGARFTDGIKDQENWWAKNVTKDDIYVYTFGTIKVLVNGASLPGGYENIHNIYNYYDSYGPNGVQWTYQVSSSEAKFGHTHRYTLYYDEGVVVTPLLTCKNHEMANYKEALDRHLVTGCPTFQQRAIKVKKVKITGSSSKIAVGKKIPLMAVVSPSTASNQAVIWRSSNMKYATVDRKGVVTIKKAGGGKTVTITATAEDGSKKSASYKIQCMKGVVKKIAIAGEKRRTVKAGESVKLKASIQTTKGANTVLEWSSDDTKYATVNNKGQIVTKKAGKGKSVKITVAATDGSKEKASVIIKIK